MRTVALEEHFNIPALVDRIPKEVIAARGFLPPEKRPKGMLMAEEKLKEIADGRIADMDAAGVTMQVLSVSGPGADLLPPAQGVAWAKEANDTLASAVSRFPDRFAGFSHLPTTAPEAAAEELSRCVKSLGFVGALINGMTGDQFLDAPAFDPILAAAETLDVPIYIHPNIPPESVRKAYYQELPEPMGFLLSIAGFGWHAETAIHVLRLVLSGALDRHPKLKIIIGHMGEFLPMTLARSDAVTQAAASKFLKRSLAQTLREQVYVTTSGQFTIPPMMVLLETFGIDHVLFSIDYPYSPNDRGRNFLENLPLAPADVEKIAHGNADRILKLRNGGLNSSSD